MGLDISEWGETHPTSYIEVLITKIVYWFSITEKNEKVKNGLSWTLEYDIWIELDLGKGRVEESEGRKESSTAESGE